MKRLPFVYNLFHSRLLRWTKFMFSEYSLSYSINYVTNTPEGEARTQEDKDTTLIQINDNNIIWQCTDIINWMHIVVIANVYNCLKFKLFKSNIFHKIFTWTTWIHTRFCVICGSRAIRSTMLWWRICAWSGSYHIAIATWTNATPPLRPGRPCTIDCVKTSRKLYTRTEYWQKQIDDWYFLLDL